MKIGDRLIAETVRIGRVMAVGGEAATCRVEAVHAAAIGANPQRTLLVVMNGINIIVAQRGWVVGVVLVAGNLAG